MKLFKHILVATDFADSSARAVDLAIKLALGFDADLTLLHVCEVPVYPYAEPMLTPLNLATMRQAATTRLAEALDQIKEQLPRAKSVLDMNRPAAGILSAIDSLKPDLVVMGTHGRHGFGYLLFGSVADKVVRLSKVPVLTARGTVQEPLAEPDGGSQPA